MDSVIVISATVVGGTLVFKVIWNLAARLLIKHSGFDGIDNGDGTGSIWK